MSKPNPESLISAYLDGELSSDEAAAVEQQLDASSTLREELNDFSELSRSIQALPVESAPVNFHELVVANLPEAADLAVEPVRPWWMHPMVSTAVAACLVLGIGTALTLLPTGDELAKTVKSEQGIDTDSSGQRKSHTVASLNSNRAMPASEMEADSAVASNEPSALNQSGAMLSEPIMMQKALPPNGAANDAAMGAIQTQIAGFPRQRAQVKTLTGKQLKQKLSALERTPEPGDVFSVLDETEGTPVFVEFTVVDVMDALYPGGKLNVLLRQKKGKLLTVDPTKKGAASNQDHGMMAVLLELDNADEMSLVLNDIPALEAFVYMDDHIKMSPADKPAPDDGYTRPPKLKIPQNFIFTASILKEELSPLRQIESEFSEEVASDAPPAESPRAQEPSNLRVRQTGPNHFGPEPEGLESSPMPIRALLLIREGNVEP